MEDLEIMSKDNLINMSQAPTQQEITDLGYNCPQCPSLIEIISINNEKNVIQFNCVNNNKHNNNMNIKEYIDKMKNYNNKKNISRICDKHNEEYIFYCNDCRTQLCNECAKNKMQKKHKKIYLFDELPEEDEINIIKNKIKDYKNMIENLEKEKEKKVNYLNRKLNIDKRKENETKKILLVKII